jgi:hypothetical protein
MAIAVPIAVLIGVKGQQVLYPIRFSLPFERGITVSTAGILTNILEVRKEGHEYAVTFDKQPTQAEVDLLTKLIQNGIWETVTIT